MAALTSTSPGILAMVYPLSARKAIHCSSVSATIPTERLAAKAMQSRKGWGD